MDYGYTQICEDRLWELSTNDEDTEKKVLDFLSDCSRTATFGARLKRFIAQECNVSEDQASQYLKECCRREGIEINANTIKNWFSVAGPKKGGRSRELMLRVAFALRLNVAQTNLLFQKVYLDRGLYPRRFEEYTAEFCLKKGLGWADWQSILKQYPCSTEQNDQTVYTRVLQKELDNIENLAELSEYLQKYSHNFSIQNKSARAVLDDLLRKVKGNSAGTGEVDQEIAESDNLQELLRGRPHDTNEAMVQVITNRRPEAKDNGKNARAILAGSILPHEIRTNFPEAAVFSKRHLSYEELRKMIVLLGSYYLWRQEARSGKLLDLDQYVSEMDDRLSEAGLAPLYYGNPFDWMFLFSAKEDNHLDCFRGILAEALDT